jgi:hypothetical protein
MRFRVHLLVQDCRDVEEEVDRVQIAVPDRMEAMS